MNKFTEYLKTEHPDVLEAIKIDWEALDQSEKKRQKSMDLSAGKKPDYPKPGDKVVEKQPEKQKKK